MRVFFTICLLCLVLCPGAAAAEPEIPGLDQLWETAQGYGVTEGEDLEGGLSNLFQDAWSNLGDLLRRSAVTAGKLLAIAALCALARGAGEDNLQAVEITGALAITALTVSDMGAMIGLGRDTIGKMNIFSDVLLPVMAVLTAATGQATGAAVRQGATMLFVQLLLSLVDGVLIPLIYAYMAVCCAQAAVDSPGLGKIAALLKGAAQGLLTGVLLAFVGYLTASGAIAGTADAAAIKAAKLAMGRMIPVVGSILADAAESVLAGAGILKGTVGAAGLLVVLAICITPFLRLGLHYLTYKVAAALTATIASPRLSQLVDSIGSAFGLVLGMTGACALLLLFSLVSAVTAVAL
jgi:stage III sporulation protein AE